MTKNKPPKIAEWMLSRAVDSSIRYSALGDFEEQFQLIVEKSDPCENLVFAASNKVPATIRGRFILLESGHDKKLSGCSIEKYV